MAAINGKVIYITDWSDRHPLIVSIQDDAMLPLHTGIYFHHRLQTLIVVKSELPASTAIALPPYN